MRKFLSFLLLSIFCLVATSYIATSFNTAKAATTGTVAATVTAVIYSVSLDNGDGIAFGSVAQSSTQDTTTAGVDDSTTATNNGSVSEKLSIRAADSTDWTLGAAAGDETYTMQFCTSDCDGAPSWSDVGISPSYATLAASVAATGTQAFDLQVGTPTTTVATGEQSITVTILAEAP